MLDTEKGEFRLPLVSEDYVWPDRENDVDLINILKLSQSVNVNFKTVGGVLATDEFGSDDFSLAVDEAKQICWLVDFLS